MRTTALTRTRRRNARELFGAALTLAGESVRTSADRDSSERDRDELRRTLCTIAERLGFLGLDVESLIAQVRCGHHRAPALLRAHRRGAWSREFTPALRRPGGPLLVAPAREQAR